ncbi:MAG: hemolysin family protein [Nitrospinota bacterium]
MSLTGTIITVFFCLGFEILFSGAEIALISLNRAKLNETIKKGSSTGGLIANMLKTPDVLFGTTSVGTNISVVISVSTATAFLVFLFGEKGDVYATIIMTPLILLFGEIIPKALFLERADRLAHVVIYPIWFSKKLFTPVLAVTSKITSWILFFIVKNADEKKDFVTRKELVYLMQHGDKRLDLAPEEQKMIQNIFEFHETTVRECMVPLIDLVAVNKNISQEGAKKIMLDSNFSRIPVFEGRVYNICGILTSKDLFINEEETRGIRHIIQPAYFVPETKRINELFKELQLEGTHIAVVVDEYGGTVGIVTVEDMLEEVVGEIKDEFDEKENLYQKLSDTAILIDARAELDALEDDINVSIPCGDYETLGGFLLDKFQKIPKKGESLQHQNYNFTIVEAEATAINKVRLDFPSVNPENNNTFLEEKKDKNTLR